jgi:hypothetical protein
MKTKFLHFVFAAASLFFYLSVHGNSGSRDSAQGPTERVKWLQERISRGGIEVSNSEKNFAKNYVYVAYPGGLPSYDVFVENFDALHSQFQVPRSQTLFRYVSGRAQARYANSSSDSLYLRSIDNPTGTRAIVDSEFLSSAPPCGMPRSDKLEFDVLNEAYFLSKIYRELGKPLIVLCHSANCRRALAGILGVLQSRGNSEIIKAAFIMQGVSIPTQVMPLLNSVNQFLSSSRSSQNESCVVGAQLDNLTLRDMGQRVFFISDGDSRSPEGGVRPASNKYAPSDFGQFLGPLSVGHIHAVVGNGPQRSNYPPAFRHALMHFLMQVAQH